jgi:hypothetical protein
MKRMFELHIDAGDEENDKMIADALIDLFSVMNGITYRFVSVTEPKHDRKG